MTTTVCPEKGTEGEVSLRAAVDLQIAGMQEAVRAAMSPHGATWHPRYGTNAYSKLREQA